MDSSSPSQFRAINTQMQMVNARGLYHKLQVADCESLGRGLWGSISVLKKQAHGEGGPSVGPPGSVSQSEEVKDQAQAREQGEGTHTPSAGLECYSTSIITLIIILNE